MAGRLTQNSGQSLGRLNPSKQSGANPATPYFYTKTDRQGGAIGYSQDEFDSSGRPFFAYRNPGDTSTTTDKTRVATTIDPRYPTTTPRTSFTNPRAPGLRDKYTNIKPDEELDHTMALALAGSNDPSNLRAIPKAQNQGAAPAEGRLSKDVSSGKLPLFKAQVEEATSKKTPQPWVPAGTVPPPTPFDATPGGYIQNFLQGLAPAAYSLPGKIYDAFETMAPGVKAARESIQQRSFEPYKKFWSDREAALARGPFIKDENGNTIMNPESENLIMGFVAPGEGNLRLLKKGIVPGNPAQTLKNAEARLGVKPVVKPVSVPPAIPEKPIEIPAPKPVQSGPSSIDLLNEAKKYKSAEDFIKNVTKKDWGELVTQPSDLRFGRIGPDKIVKESVKLPFGVESYVARDGDLFTVIEKKTGQVIGKGSRLTRGDEAGIRQAITDATTALQNEGEQKVAQGIAEARKAPTDGFYRYWNRIPDEQLTDIYNKAAQKPIKYSSEGIPLALTRRQRMLASGATSNLERASGKSRGRLNLQEQPRTPASTEINKTGELNRAGNIEEYRKQPDLTSSDRTNVQPQSSANPADLSQIGRAAQQPGIPEAKLPPTAGDILSTRGPSGGGGVRSLPEIVDRSFTKAKDKINVLDYFRTPERVLEKIGFGKEARRIRAGYDAYVKELPKNIDKITAWSKRVPADASQRIFKWLDGQHVILDRNETQVAQEIRSWLQDWANRLKLPRHSRLTNYITHVFEDDLIAKEFDEDLAKIIADKIPGQVYDPFTLKRIGSMGYKEDVWKALDAYVKRGTRKVNMDPALQAVRDKAGSSLEMSNIEASQFKYLQRYINNVNMRPTEIDNLVDNAFKSVAGYKFGQRPVARFSRFLRQLTFRGMLGLNPGSALRNISQGINTYAVLGEKYTAIGYGKLFSKGAFDELSREGVLSQGFIQDRVLSSTKKAMEMVDKGLFAFFETAERINRGSAYFGAKSKALSQGMTEPQAIEYAKDVVRKTQFNFGSIDTPVALQTDIVKTLLQFQSYTTKQIEFLAGLAKDQNFLGLLRYAVGGLAFTYTIGKAFGMDPMELIPKYRIATPPSLQLGAAIGSAALNLPDDYGQPRDWKEKASDVAKASVGFFPAGTQAKKTYEGIQTVRQGGSYDKAGRLQFKQGDSLPEKAQSIIFGKYASQNAKDYFAGKPTGEIAKLNREESLKNKETRTKAQSLDKELQSLPKEEANSRAAELKKSDPQLSKSLSSVIKDRKLDRSPEEKQMLSLGVKNGTRAKYIYEHMEKLPEGERKAYYDNLRKKKIVTDEVNAQIKKLRQ